MTTRGIYKISKIINLNGLILHFILIKIKYNKDIPTKVFKATET